MSGKYDNFCVYVFVCAYVCDAVLVWVLLSHFLNDDREFKRSKDWKFCVCTFCVCTYGEAALERNTSWNILRAYETGSSFSASMLRSSTLF